MDEEYKKALRDGRWQIRKTEIMRRDGFACKECGAKASDGVVLNVHHRKYYPGKMPWEYEDENLVTLCEDCHAEYHRQKKEFEEELKNSWSVDELCNITGKLVYIEYKNPPVGATGFWANHFIYLFTDKVYDCMVAFSHFSLPCIEAAVMFQNATPLFEDWEFSSNGNDEVKMSPLGTAFLSYEDKVEVFCGTPAIELASKMINGAEYELDELIQSQKYNRLNNPDFDEFTASLDRSEYEEIIKLLKDFVVTERTKVLEKKNTEIQRTVACSSNFNRKLCLFSWKSLRKN